MDKDHGSEFFRLRPERVELRRAQVDSVYASSDQAAPHAHLFHGLLQLLSGQIRVLKSHCRHADESVQMRRTKLRHPLVLEIHEFSSDVAVGRIPKWIDAHCLDINSPRIHSPE